MDENGLFECSVLISIHACAHVIHTNRVQLPLVSASPFSVRIVCFEVKFNTRMRLLNSAQLCRSICLFPFACSLRLLLFVVQKLKIINSNFSQIINCASIFVCVLRRTTFTDLPIDSRSPIKTEFDHALQMEICTLVNCHLDRPIVTGSLQHSIKSGRHQILQAAKPSTKIA